MSRTFEGYQTEIATIYGQLEVGLKHKIEPAPDEWDRKFGVDFFIKISDQYIGIQIKPISSGQSLNQYQWVEMHRKKHEQFREKFGGKVFFVYSVKGANDKKTIFNKEVIEEIVKEIEALSSKK